MENFLMNPISGSVQTEKDWGDEGFDTENSDLVPVVKVDGRWVEA